MMHSFTPKQIKEGAKELASWIQNLIDDGKAARSVCDDWWRECESMYRMERGSTPVTLIDGVEIYPSSFLTSRVDRIVKGVQGSIFAPVPYVSAVPDNPEQERADELEEGFQTILQKCRIEEHLRVAVRLAALHGQSFLWPVMTAGGFELSVVAAKDFIANPTWGKKASQLDLAGHKYQLPRWEVETRQNAEDNPWRRFAVGSSVEHQDNRAPVTSSAQMNDPVELWNLIVRIPVNEGTKAKQKVSYKYYRVILAYDECEICLIEDYPYNRPWYVPVRLAYEYQEFWVQDCPARRLQSLQHLHTVLSNLLTQGTMSTAFPPVVVNNAQLAEKFKTYKMASIIAADGDVKASSLPVTFKGDWMPQLLAEIERQGDAIVGSTQLGSGQNMPGNTTATAAAAVMEAQRVADNDYTAYIGDSLEDLLELMQHMAQKHVGTFSKVYDKCAPPAFFDALEMSVQWQATGRRPESSPDVAMQKALLLMELTKDPRTRLDYAQVEQAVVNAMRLPIPTDSLYVEDLPNGGGNPLASIQPIPGMGGDSALPIGEGSVPPAADQIMPGLSPEYGGGISQGGSLQPPF
jgi:hypothetical protein